MAQTIYATVNDVIDLFRPLTVKEQERAESLIPVVSDLLRQAAKNAGKDLDQMLEDGDVYASAVKSVVVDVVSRTLLTSTSNEPMTQMSQSAGGYSMSGTFLNPGGGIFIKRSELASLGIRRQKLGVIDFA